MKKKKKIEKPRLKKKKQFTINQNNLKILKQISKQNRSKTKKSRENWAKKKLEKERVTFSKKPNTYD